MTCVHKTFNAMVSVARFADPEDAPPTGYMAEIRIHCVDCGRPFQFLGLEAGVDTRGARMSVDGLEANIAICPQGEVLSPLDRVVANFGAPRGRRLS